MLVLFENAAGYAVFKLLDERKIQEVDNIWKEFESPEKANRLLKLMTFKKFKDTTEALAAATAAIDGKLGKSLKKLLKKCVPEELQEQMAVADAKLGNVIKEKLNISCVNNQAINELMRGIRQQMDTLIADISKKDVAAMSLGLAHSLSRYKLKFSPDKVDTMIVQAVSLLDDLDKELNNYIMRCREWYGWHFPELGKIVQDHMAFAKVVKAVGLRHNTHDTDLSGILPEELEQKVKEAAEISMGTEISELDILNIRQLCDQVIEITEYRAQLYDYLKNRMMALAPNLTVLLGELVGARLIAHAGSLMSLAKYPASTVQILGAEKALFRALKTKRDTPKYGLIYHAQLIGQAPGKLKGKMSRMLAAKASLACRVDAIGEDGLSELGVEHRAKLEMRIKQLQEQGTRRISGQGRQMGKFDKWKPKTDADSYDQGFDSTLPQHGKRKFGSEEAPKSKKFRGDEEADDANGNAPKGKGKRSFGGEDDETNGGGGQDQYEEEGGEEEGEEEQEEEAPPPPPSTKKKRF